MMKIKNKGKDLIIFKKFGDSAIFDSGFNFHLTLKIDLKIKKLIEDMKILSECIATHEEWKNESWYNSKTTVGIIGLIEGYDMFSKFTYRMAKKVYAERKDSYDLLISLSEDALKSAKKEYSEYPTKEYLKPYYKDIEREFVIVDFIEE